jgi:hypothetical protein
VGTGLGPAPTVPAMTTQVTEKAEEQRRLLARVVEEYQVDFEARQALLGLIIRLVDEVRFGMREIDVEQLRGLTSMWSDLNDGLTPSEVALRLLKDME